MMSSPSSRVHPVYAVATAERLLRDNVLKDILAKLGDEMDTLGPTRVDGAAAELAEVLDELRTLSLLGGRRVVVVNDADGFISAHRSALEKYCAAPAQGGCLILLCNTLPASTRLFKAISKTGAVVRPEVPKGRGVLTWLQDQAQTVHGKRLRGAATQMLLDHVGGQLGVLDAELSKLATFVGGRDEITTTDVDTLIGKHREERVFAVTDAMDVGDAPAALRHWQQVLATDRAAPARAMAGLAWSVRRFLDARRQWERGADLRMLARTMYTDPQILRRRFQEVSTAQLEQRQRDLLAADLDVKTGLTSVGMAIDKFIIKHTVMAGSSA